MHVTTDTTTAAESGQPTERTCQCDCRRWAHEAWKVCEFNVPRGRLARLYFDDTTDPRGVYPRDVCPTCAEHVKSARARGGEVLADGDAQPPSQA